MYNLVNRPHYTSPSIEATHVIFCYRNFMAKSSQWSHQGLGVNCINSAKVLRANQIRADVQPVWDISDLASVIASNPTATHIVIEAPFLASSDIHNLTNKYTNIEFCCRAHSQIAFLQVEAGAINLIRDYIRLQDQSLNFKMAVNSDRLGQFLGQAYNNNSLYLPNLYYHDNVQVRAWHAPAKLLKIGSFGAIRLMKNHITGAAAALMIAANHKKDLQFYLSVNREENGGGVLQAIRNLFTSVPFAQLNEVTWTGHSDFVNIISNLDLHMQLSMSETFNITSADAAVRGIPTVASEAIDWVPNEWYANIDDCSDVSRIGWNLLNDPHAGQRGIAALNKFNATSLNLWKNWFSGNASTMPSFHLS